MAYPAKPVPEPLPQFRGTALIRQTAEQRQRLLDYVSREYRAGRSLRELAALTDRSQTAIRRALHEAGIPLREPGAPRLTDEHGSGLGNPPPLDGGPTAAPSA